MNEIKADSAAVPGRVRNAALIPAPGCLGSYRLRPPSASLAGALLVFATTIVPFGRASGQVTAHGCDGGDLGDECSLLELRDTLGGRFVVASPTRTYSMHSWRVSDDFPILGNPAQVRVSVDATDVDHPVIRFEAALPTALRNDDDSIVTNRSLLGRFAFDPVETTFVGTIEVSADFTVSAGDVSAICGDQPEGGSAAIAGTSIRPSEFALPVASAHVTLETAPVASAAVVPPLSRGNVDFSMTATFCDDPDTAFRGFSQIDWMEITLGLLDMPVIGDANCDRGLTAADLAAVIPLIATGERSICELDDTDGDGVIDGRDLDNVIAAIFAGGA